MAVALAIGVAATGAGALLHREEDRSCGEGGRDCVYYDYYNWPWERTANAPDSLLQPWQDDGECGSFCYNEEGYSGGIFLFTTAMWTLTALVAEGLLAVIAYGVGRLFVRRKRVASV